MSLPFEDMNRAFIVLSVIILACTHASQYAGCWNLQWVLFCIFSSLCHVAQTNHYYWSRHIRR